MQFRQRDGAFNAEQLSALNLNRHQALLELKSVESQVLHTLHTSRAMPAVVMTAADERMRFPRLGLLKPGASTSSHRTEGSKRANPSTVE
jgi:hypothetical protein